MKVLGLDVGEKRIGVAKVDSKVRVAVPVGVVAVDGSEWQEIARFLRLNDTKFLVLGLPRNNEGNETQQSQYVRNFAKILLEKIPGAKVRFQDESLTSVIAEERLKARKKNYQRGDIDAEAAVVILEDFIEGLKGDSDFSSEGAKLGLAALSAPEEGKSESPNKCARKGFSKKSIIIAVVILVVLVALGVGGGIYIAKKLDERQKRQEYYAQLESEMEPEVFNFTILPGETIFDIKKKLIKAGYLNEEVEAGFSADYDFEFLKNRPAGASLEGFLYPETHEFYKDASVKDILSVFLQEMERIITENDLEARYAAQGLNLFEGITLASVVQKESAAPDQPTVAQVFLTRLAHGMALGSDVTVSYALDVLDPERQTYTDNLAALAVDSCYNTRLHAGLPCGPIANPGLSALLAVAEPTDTAYLYFLTGDNGLMYYGYTEYEHEQNRINHCRVLCNVSL